MNRKLIHFLLFIRLRRTKINKTLRKTFAALLPGPPQADEINANLRNGCCSLEKRQTTVVAYASLNTNDGVKGKKENVFFELLFLIRFSKILFHLKTEVIMYAAVRHYHFKPEDGKEIDEIIREGFVPLLKKAKGFVRYYWVDTGNGEGASMSVFKDKAGADESIRIAAEFVKSKMAHLFHEKPEIIEGPVAAHD